MSSSRKRKKKEAGGAASWVVTYSDLMSLLLTFFILLYSISTVDAEKFRNITEYLQIALTGEGRPAILDGGAEDITLPIDDEAFSDDKMPVDDIVDPVNQPLPNEIKEMFNKVNGYLVESGIDAKVGVMMKKSGVTVEIKDAILFETGSAQLKESGIELLEKLEGLLNDFDNDIVVEGHTDNVPLNNEKYPSNWELSAARAVAVLRYLNEVQNVAPTRLSARGYGEYSPIEKNDGPDNRRKNRRVNLLIVFDQEEGL